MINMWLFILFFIFLFVTMSLVRSIHGESDWPSLVGSPLPTTFFPFTKLEFETLLKEFKPSTTRTNEILVYYFFILHVYV